jgi:hypothetical protein
MLPADSRFLICICTVCILTVQRCDCGCGAGGPADGVGGSWWSIHNGPCALSRRATHSSHRLRCGAFVFFLALHALQYTSLGACPSCAQARNYGFSALSPAALDAIEKNNVTVLFSSPQYGPGTTIVGSTQPTWLSTPSCAVWRCPLQDLAGFDLYDLTYIYICVCIDVTQVRRRKVSLKMNCIHNIYTQKHCRLRFRRIRHRSCSPANCHTGLSSSVP